MNRSLLLSAVLLAACAASNTPSPGSQTHFLDTCGDGNCPDGLACVCGVCTVACDDDALCAAQAESAICTERAGSCRGEARVCDVECTSDRDCSALGESFGCESGRCRAGSAPDGGTSPDAQVADGGSDQDGGQPTRPDAGQPTPLDAGQPAQPDASVAFCGLPPVPGPCEALIPRYYFDAPTNSCRMFNYGGCEGNDNNFETREECERTCNATPRCELPPDTGPCFASIPRYHHDAASGSCRMFIYGGCGGNTNNFGTQGECEAACSGTPRCEQPVDTGPCDAAIPRYYYDSAAGACREFSYGGCEGNENNFSTLGDCESTCGSRPGATACEVDGVVYPSGTDGIDDPQSCNTCFCNGGQLSCTEIGCPEPCPAGTEFATSCSQCGPADGCEILRTGCLPTCETSDDCTGDAPPYCFDGICRILCG